MKGNAPAILPTTVEQLGLHVVVSVWWMEFVPQAPLANGRTTGRRIAARQGLALGQNLTWMALPAPHGLLILMGFEMRCLLLSLGNVVVMTLPEGF